MLICLFPVNVRISAPQLKLYTKANKILSWTGEKMQTILNTSYSCVPHVATWSSVPLDTTSQEMVTDRCFQLTTEQTGLFPAFCQQLWLLSNLKKPTAGESLKRLNIFFHAFLYIILTLCEEILSAALSKVQFMHNVWCDIVRNSRKATQWLFPQVKRLSFNQSIMFEPLFWCKYWGKRVDPKPPEGWFLSLSVAFKWNIRSWFPLTKLRFLLSEGVLNIMTGIMHLFLTCVQHDLQAFPSMFELRNNLRCMWMKKKWNLKSCFHFQIVITLHCNWLG